MIEQELAEIDERLLKQSKELLKFFKSILPTYWGNTRIKADILDIIKDLEEQCETTNQA